MSKRPEISTTEKVQEAIKTLANELRKIDFTGPSRKRVAGILANMRSQIDAIERDIDEVQLPTAFFDPSEPALIGRFASLALVAQPRLPLDDVPKSYGAGIYALYYTGSFPLYTPISGTETPIYVGLASPPPSNPKTLVEQGQKLSGRLNEHRKNLRKISNLNIDDFEYRSLAVQSGFQASAESHLITLFRPIWNKETKILFGLGKHGDSSDTRSNNKSPFDTMHPGRAWAGGSPETKSVEVISAQVSAHFETVQLYADTDAVLHAFLESIQS